MSFSDSLLAYFLRLDIYIALEFLCSERSSLSNMTIFFLKASSVISYPETDFNVRTSMDIDSISMTGGSDCYMKMTGPFK